MVADPAKAGELKGKYFLQTKDIELTETNWKTINPDREDLGMYYDGGYNTIKGLRMEVRDETKFIGLFGVMNEVMNLIVKDPEVLVTTEQFVKAAILGDFWVNNVIIDGGSFTWRPTNALTKGEYAVGSIKSPVGSYNGAAVTVDATIGTLEGPIKIDCFYLQENSINSGTYTLKLKKADGADLKNHPIEGSFCPINHGRNSLNVAKIIKEIDPELMSNIYELDVAPVGSGASDCVFDKTLCPYTPSGSIYGLTTAELQVSQATAENTTTGTGRLCGYGSEDCLNSNMFSFKQGRYPTITMAAYLDLFKKIYPRYRIYEEEYLISNELEFNFFVWVVNNGRQKSVAKQMNDLEFTEPPRQFIFDFQGLYNGNGYKIKGLELSIKESKAGDSEGLFGTLSNGQLLNVHLVDPKIKVELDAGGNSLKVGSLVGTTKDYAKVANCRAQGVQLEVTGGTLNTDRDYIGGLIGYVKRTTSWILYSGVDGATMTTGSYNVTMGGLIGGLETSNLHGCYAKGVNMKVSAQGAGNTQRVGGLIGQLQNEKTTIHRCFATGSMLVEGDNGKESSLGGFIGDIEKVRNSEISQCYSEVSINATTGTIGGFAGRLVMPDASKGVFSIKDCYVLLGPEANDGALIVDAEHAAESKIAGFIGYLKTPNNINKNTRVENCYAATPMGPATGKYFKPFANFSDSALAPQYAVNCYVLGALLPAGLKEWQLANGSVKVVDAAQFAQVSTFQGYDFTSSQVWYMAPSSEKWTAITKQHPRLCSELIEPLHPTKGNGLQDTPYEIETLQHLEWLSRQGATYLAARWFKQVADIDATPTRTWNVEMDGTEAVARGFKPIGRPGSEFKGFYNGQGHTITGLYINRPAEDCVGLFGNVYQGYGGFVCIDSLTLVGVTAVGHDYVGALVGYYRGYSAVMDCHVLADSVVGNAFVGGLVGKMQYKTSFQRCSAMPQNGADSYVKVATRNGGGFVGEMADEFMVEKCYTTLPVRSTGASAQAVGGFVGSIAPKCAVSYCYAWGDLSVQDASTEAGGFVGNFKGKMASECYATGKIRIAGSANNELQMGHGFCGTATGDILKSYYLNSQDGTPITNALPDEPGKCEGRSEEQLKSGDFSVLQSLDKTIWRAEKGRYPILQDIPDRGVVHFSVEGGHGQIAIEGVLNGSLKPVGTELTIALTPDQDYEVASLTANGNPIPVTANKASWKVVHDDNSIVAKFKKVQAPVTFTVDGSNGSIGIEGITSGSSVEVGTVLNIMLRPAIGYDVESLTANGTQIPVVDYKANWTVINGDNNLVAKFKTANYPVTFTVDGGNGQISIEGISSGDNVGLGMKLAITLTPDDGFVVESLTANGEAITVTDNKANWTVVKGNNDLVAKFKKKEANTPERGTVTYTVEGGNGQIAIEGVSSGQEVEVDTELHITLTPAQGYELESLTGNGTLTAVTDNRATWRVVKGDNALVAKFKQKSSGEQGGGNGGANTAVESVLLTGVTAGPNPTGGLVYLYGAEHATSCTVLSPMGQVLQRIPLQGSGQTAIDLSAYPGGIYLLRLEDHLGAGRTLRVVKQ